MIESKTCPHDSPKPQMGVYHRGQNRVEFVQNEKYSAKSADFFRFFAHHSFKWTNNAKYNAGVTCVIVGVREVAKGNK